MRAASPADTPEEAPDAEPQSSGEAACTQLAETTGAIRQLETPAATSAHPLLVHYRDALRASRTPGSQRALDAITLADTIAIEPKRLAESASLLAATRILPLALRAIPGARTARVARALERQTAKDGIAEALNGVRGQYDPSGVVIGHEPSCESEQAGTIARCMRGDAAADAVLAVEAMLDGSALTALAALLELLEASRKAGAAEDRLERRAIELLRDLAKLPKSQSPPDESAHPLLIELKAWLIAALPERAAELEAVDLQGTAEAEGDALLARVIACEHALPMQHARACVAQLSDRQTEFDAYVGAPSPRADAARKLAQGEQLLGRAEQLLAAGEPAVLANAALAIERVAHPCNGPVGAAALEYLETLARWSRAHREDAR